MDLLDPAVERHLRSLVPEPDPVRADMERLAAERRFPIIGPLVGQLCGVMALAAGARRVFEMGSGFGYSTLWFARAVGETGTVVHTEGSQDNSRLAREFLTRAGVAGRVRFEVGDAREIADRYIERGEMTPCDILFNDIDKEQYPDVLPRARRLLRTGGLMICDNMIWFGRVLTPPAPGDEETRGILELTRQLKEAPDFVTTLIPIRDGVTVSVRSSG